MRTLVAVLLAGCSVPDKHPTTDAGVGDAPTDGSMDLDAPNTRILQAPGEFSREGAATFVFESDDPTATFRCSIDRETPVGCSTPYTRTLGDGQHGFVVRAVDDAGNTDDSPAEHRWTIDTVAPETTITERPPLADNSVFVRFDFDSSEDNVTFECSLDNAAFDACEGNGQIGPLSDGPHSFAVRARDRAGNFDVTPAVFAWSVDTSTPDTQILSGPADVSPTTTATFTFVSPDAGSGATFQCSLNSAAFTACASPITYTNLGERAHAFAVRVRDAVGNFDPTPATRAWRVDLTPPNTTITGGPIGAVPTASASFTFTSNEQDVRFECRVDTAAFAACTSPHTIMMLSQGAHAFAVRAIDAADRLDASPATRAWTVDTVVPAITIGGGPANGSTSGPRVTFTFTTSEGAPECSADGAPFAACASPMSFNLPAGAHSFAVRATDAAGNIGSATRTWTVACAAPTPAGAAGLLHLDDAGQTLANAVAGGAAAMLGDDLTAEPDDPTPGAGRFAGGLAFDPLQLDHVAWPVALGPTAEFSIELWSNANAAAGTHAVLASGDGRLALRVTAASPTTVRYTIEVVEAGMGRTIVATAAPVAAASWHHVLASLAGPTLRLWVDGARTEAGVVDLAMPLALDTLQLGGTYDGSLDEVWLAQTAISNDEMALVRYCPL